MQHVITLCTGSSAASEEAVKKEVQLLKVSTTTNACDQQVDALRESRGDDLLVTIPGGEIEGCVIDTRSSSRSEL